MNASYPAEWSPWKALWLAWPHRVDLWGEDLPLVQEEFRQFLRHALEGLSGQNIRLLVPNESCVSKLKEEYGDASIEYVVEDYGDIWLRDTGPLFFPDSARAFRFNGWGQKYWFEEDKDLARRLASRAGKNFIQSPLVAEGGAFEWDGEGTCLSTRNCLLEPLRNPEWSEEDLRSELAENFGVQKLILCEGSLLNDHTDGHIDTLARFCAPARVLLMEALSESDPNRELFGELKKQLKSQKDAHSRELELLMIPSPGCVPSSEGVLPASYLNFLITPKSVIVPTYHSDFDERALQELSKAFPNHRVVGSPALAILKGGGAFHCISQQEY